MKFVPLNKKGLQQRALLVGVLMTSISMPFFASAHGSEGHEDLEDEWYMNIESMDDLKVEHHDQMNHDQMNHDQMNHDQMNHDQMNHDQMNHDQMNHDQMNHDQMNHDQMNHDQMNHDQMNHDQMNHGQMNHDQMDHDMSGMQGGSAPESARDPHAYSGGYTLTSGPYAMEGPRQLVLADEKWFSSATIEKLGLAREHGNNHKVVEGEFWVGNTWDRLVLELEAERFDGENDVELGAYWRHALTAFWNIQLGVKREQSDADARHWLGLGFQGLAPYWFESEAMLYVGKQGVTRLDLTAEYDILLTQRWIVALELEASLAGKNDPEGEFASGLVSTSVAPYLRYEITRQFAPYIGIQREHWYGNSRNLKESAATVYQAGVRLWF